MRTHGAYSPGDRSPSFQTSRLEICRLLGRGAFGEVLLVKAIPHDAHSGVPQLVALKRASVADISEQGADRALAEARLLQRLGEEHPAILRCFDFRIVPGSSPALDLLLEFAPLGDLHSRIQSHKEAQPDLAAANVRVGIPEVEAASYAFDIASALEHMHSLRPKVLHRDVKPANVILFPGLLDGLGRPGRGNIPRVKLADFGIAKILESECSLAGAATVVGTPHYFSPELCRGEPYDERADAWALGCVMYEMMCLHRPFHKVEGNVAVLAVRVSEGAYDSDALSKRSGVYNGVMIMTVASLLKWDAIRRYRMSDVLNSLHWVVTAEAVAKLEANGSAAWWDAHEVPTVHTEYADPNLGLQGDDDCLEEDEDGNMDSWYGAEEVCPDRLIAGLPPPLSTVDPPTLRPEDVPQGDPNMTLPRTPVTPMPHTPLAASTPLAQTIATPLPRTPAYTLPSPQASTGDSLLKTQYLDKASFGRHDAGGSEEQGATRMAWGGDRLEQSFGAHSHEEAFEQTIRTEQPESFGPPETPTQARPGSRAKSPARRVFLRPIRRGNLGRKAFNGTASLPRRADRSDDVETPMVFYFPRPESGSEVSTESVAATVTPAGGIAPPSASLRPLLQRKQEAAEWVEVQLPTEVAAEVEVACPSPSGDAGIFSLTSAE